MRQSVSTPDTVNVHPQGEVVECAAGSAGAVKDELSWCLSTAARLCDVPYSHPSQRARWGERPTWARASAPHRVRIKPPKRKGELADLEFLRTAVRLGFRVSKPYGDSDRYDFVVDTGERLVRVQVRSASHLSEDNLYFIGSRRRVGGTGIPYKAGEIDYLAAYVFPEDAWFIIPVEAFVPRASIHLYPRERGEIGMYARYREAWWLLREAGIDPVQ
jgi:hypothetical protein